MKDQRVSVNTIKILSVGAVVPQVLLQRRRLQGSFNVLICLLTTRRSFKASRVHLLESVTNLFFAILSHRVTEARQQRGLCVYLLSNLQPPTEFRLKKTCRTQHRESRRTPGAKHAGKERHTQRACHSTTADWAADLSCCDTSCNCCESDLDVWLVGLFSFFFFNWATVICFYEIFHNLVFSGIVAAHLSFSIFSPRLVWLWGAEETWSETHNAPCPTFSPSNFFRQCLYPWHCCCGKIHKFQHLAT